MAFGNSNSKIGLANIIIAIMQGIPIKIDTNKENDILFLTVSIFPIALDDEIDGTKAVANAIFSDIGKVTKVSTFPLKIPY